MSGEAPRDEQHTPPPAGGGPRLFPRALVAIVGATATGKTRLAIELAERLGGEIVNADSRQVYRGMDIGTAKPSLAERESVRHWLVEVADPDEPFNLRRYLDLAGEALDDCWSRGVLPVLAGGTGQYVWAFLEGWQVPRVPADSALRAELEAIAASRGPEPLLSELARVDPDYYARVDRKNLRRVIRALEVYRHTGRPISACQTRTPPECSWTVVGLSCERDTLHRRIDARVDAMMAAGLLAEVRALIERGYGCHLPSMSGIAYRQMCEHITGEIALEEAVERMKTETHRLARMQHAWFRPDDDRIRWIDIERGDPLDAALRIVESELSDDR